MEKLGTLPQKDFRETSGVLIAWAEEFVRTGEKDLLIFFQNKTKDIG